MTVLNVPSTPSRIEQNANYQVRDTEFGWEFVRAPMMTARSALLTLVVLSGAWIGIGLFMLSRGSSGVLAFLVCLAGPFIGALVVLVGKGLDVAAKHEPAILEYYRTDSQIRLCRANGLAVSRREVTGLELLKCPLEISYREYRGVWQLNLLTSTNRHYVVTSMLITRKVANQLARELGVELHVSKAARMKLEDLPGLSL